MLDLLANTGSPNINRQQSDLISAIIIVTKRYFRSTCNGNRPSRTDPAMKSDANTIKTEKWNTSIQIVTPFFKHLLNISFYGLNGNQTYRSFCCCSIF